MVIILPTTKYQFNHLQNIIIVYNKSNNMEKKKTHTQEKEDRLWKTVKEINKNG